MKRKPHTFVIHAQKGAGPVLAYAGKNVFSNSRKAHAFKTQAAAVFVARAMVGRFPMLAKYRVTVEPVQSSDRKKNPSLRDGNVRKAAALFKDFSGHEVESVQRVRVKTPKAMLAIGELDGILYTTVRDGVREKYIHKFRKTARPLLAASSDGRQLGILGGEFQFTEAGIEDR